MNHIKIRDGGISKRADVVRKNADSWVDASGIGPGDGRRSAGRFDGGDEWMSAATSKSVCDGSAVDFLPKKSVMQCRG